MVEKANFQKTDTPTLHTPVLHGVHGVLSEESNNDNIPNSVKHVLFLNMNLDSC